MPRFSEISSLALSIRTITMHITALKALKRSQSLRSMAQRSLIPTATRKTSSGFKRQPPSPQRQEGSSAQDAAGAAALLSRRSDAKPARRLALTAAPPPSSPTDRIPLQRIRRERGMINWREERPDSISSAPLSLHPLLAAFRSVYGPGVPASDTSSFLSPVNQHHNSRLIASSGPLVRGLI